MNPFGTRPKKYTVASKTTNDTAIVVRWYLNTHCKVTLYSSAMPSMKRPMER